MLLSKRKQIKALKGWVGRCPVHREKVTQSSSANGFLTKITRFTKKFTRSEKKNIKFKIFALKFTALLEMMYLFT